MPGVRHLYGKPDSIIVTTQSQPITRLHDSLPIIHFSYPCQNFRSGNLAGLEVFLLFVRDRKSGNPEIRKSVQRKSCVQFLLKVFLLTFYNF